MISALRLLDIAAVLWVICGLCVGTACWFQFGIVGTLAAASFWTGLTAIAFVLVYVANN